MKWEPWPKRAGPFIKLVITNWGGGAGKKYPKIFVLKGVDFPGEM